MSKLERIHAFVAVIEENSFSGAAKKLNTAAATITRQVNALEAELGAQLIERTTRRLKLTAIGEHYYQEAKKLIDQFETTENLIAQSQKEPTGKLKVLVTRYIGLNCIIPNLNEFMQRYPKIILNLEIGERMPDFNHEDIDLVFAIAIEGQPDLVRRRLFSSRQLLCATPCYLNKYGTPKKPEDLKSHRILTHAKRSRPDVFEFPNHSEIQLQPVLWLNDSLALLRSALSGVGIAKVFAFYVQKYLDSGELVELLPQYSEKERPLYLYYRANRYIDPKIRCFIDFFNEKLQAFLLDNGIDNQQIN